MTDSDYAQKKDGWCGPAALSYALGKVGIEVNQEEIAKKSKTTVTNGCDPGPLKKVAQEYGAHVKILNGEKADETLEQIDEEVKSGYAVLVDYLVSGEKDGGHYVVFLGKKGNNIRIWDPSGGKKTEMRKDYFIANWKDRTEGGKIMKNWAMVIGA